MKTANKQSYNQTWMTIVYDSNLTIVDVINPLHCMLLQLNEDILIGKNVVDLSAITDQANRMPATIIAVNVRKAFDTQKNVYFEYATIHKDGSATSAVCYTEFGENGWLYVHVIKIDEENIFEANTEYTNYAIDTNPGNLSIGVSIRYVGEDGHKNYILFNDAAKDFFESDDVQHSPYWNQQEDDAADEKTLELHDALKMEKVQRDDGGNIKWWAMFTKREIRSTSGGCYIVTTMVDITKKRHHEILLEQQFTLLDTMYKYMPVGILFYDRYGHLVSLNQKSMDIMGVSDKQSVIGICYFDNPHTPSYIKDKVRIGESVEYEQIGDFDYLKPTTKNSSQKEVKILSIKISVIYNKDNQVDGYLQICEDITAKRTREKLTDMVYGNIPVGIIVYDKNGALVTLNQKNREIMGIPPHVDLTGLKLFEESNLPKHLIQQLKDGQNVEFNLDYSFDADKSYFPSDRSGTRPLLVKISPIKNHDTIEGYLLINQDMTDLMLRERLLEQTSAKMNTMFNSVTSGMLIYDKDGILTDCNDKGYEILGLACTGNLHDRNMSCFHNPNVPKEVVDDLKNGKEVQFSIWYDYDLVSSLHYYQTTRGGKRCVEAKGAPMLTSDKELIGYVFEINDITRSKIQEEKLRSLHSNMELALKAGHVTTWNYDIAKRIFTPLMGVASVSEGLSYEENEQKLHPDDQANLHKVFAKLESGKKKSGEIILRYYDEHLCDYRYYESKMETREDAEGHIVGIVGTQRDITEKCLKKMELDNARRSLDMVMDASNVLAWDYDLQTKKNHILYGKRLLKKHAGTIGDLNNMHPDDYVVFMKLIHQLAIGEKDEVMVDARVKDSDGSYLTFEHTISNVRNANGKVVGLLGSMYDLSERIAHQDELRKSREELNLALAAGGVSAWTYNVAEQTFYTLQGNAIAGKKGLTMLDNEKVIHPEDLPIQKQIFDDLIGGKKHLAEGVFRYKSRNGKGNYRYYESKMISKLKHGKVTTITGTQKDVTETYIRQQKLEEQNIKTTLINQTCHILQWDYDVNKKTVHTYSPDSVMPCNDFSLSQYLDFIYPDDREIVRDSFALANTKTKDVIHFDVRLKTKDCSSFINVTMDGVAIRDKDGAITKYTGIRRDVSKWMQLNRNLKQQVDINNLILSNMESGLIYADAQGTVIWNNLDCFDENSNLARFKVFIEKGRCIYCDQGYCQFSHSNCLVCESVKTKEIHTKTFCFKGFWFTVSSIPVIEESGEVTSVLYKLEDITEQQTKNIELKTAKEKAEQSDKLKSAFLANMSHEIRTPLNAIVGFSSLLAAGGNAEDKKLFISTIKANSDTLLRLINDILDLSKIESGMIGLKAEEFDMADVVANVFTAYSQKMIKPNVKFLYDAPYSSCLVCLDKHRMTQVGSNFITNAIKYTPSGYIRMGYCYEKGGVKIFVEDTGIGISKEKHDKVFERFEKLDEFAQGTGLGLSISKAITDAMHGKIGFTSEVGKGSYFWAWFPTEVELEGEKA